MTMRWACTLLSALFFLQIMAGGTEGEKAEGQNIDKYRYESIAVGGGKEFIEIDLIEAAEGLKYYSKTVSEDTLEEVTIHMKPKGEFISGVRMVTNRLSGSIRQERIWREGHKLYLERTADQNRKIKQYDLSPDRVLAVDGSLLILLRFFPFAESKQWNIFMVDFSGHNISVTVRHPGIEKITVPAGEFECYRMEVEVNIPLLRPKIIYWISSSKPHFLVKHEGKKGPFTATYVTSLVSIENR